MYDDIAFYVWIDNSFRLIHKAVNNNNKQELTS
jgi:hypothetical protein